MAGADLPLELLPGKRQQTPSRKEDVPLGAAITFQLDFELIGQPAVPASEADSSPAPQSCRNGCASGGDHRPRTPGPSTAKIRKARRREHRLSLPASWLVSARV